LFQGVFGQARRVYSLPGMDVRELEITIEATLAASRPTTRDLRDALVDYFVLVTRPFIEKGLAHTHPDADEGLIRRLLLSRLSALWRGLPSKWEAPRIEDLLAFRLRIERYACVRPDERMERARRLLDDLALAATIADKLRNVKQKSPVRKLKLISGGGEVTEPRGRLAIVRREPT
jgi:hypothetical protein